MLSPDINWIAECFARGRYSISMHGSDAMYDDGVSEPALIDAICRSVPAEIIENYADDQRGRSCLILAWITHDQPIHIVLAYWTAEPRVITVYRPDPNRWEDDYKVRKR